MTTMIERVARAIDPKGWADFEAYCARKEYDDREIAEERSRAGRVQISLAQSRAAIAAMREPTEGMVSAGNKSRPYNVVGYCEGTVHPVCQRSWPAMIDSALEEKP